MQFAKVIEKYSDKFESTVANYVTGNPEDRSDRTKFELYTRLAHTLQLFDVSKNFFELSGKRFIDVGCGTGAMAVAAALRGAQASACELVEKSLEVAKARWREHGMEGDIFAYDLRTELPQRLVGAFDFVSCFQILEHIPREGQFHALANLFRMVAPGGHLFIDTENSLAPFDRHDTRTWLVRYLTKPVAIDVLQKLGKALNYWEPSSGEKVQLHDYLSYDEVIGAAKMAGFEVTSPFMPHGTKKQMLRANTGSDWLHDSVLKDIDIERFYPIALLMQKSSASLL